MTEESWFDSCQRQHVTLCFKVLTGFEAHLAFSSLGTRDFFTDINWQELETDDRATSVAEVEN
jgi:hypothetical protein